ncbi:MAG TPA: hypothetical protein VNN79_09595 [Actinomycetota bacterium]|nr:hypothetical protein [Actinomycetota bacterium]
MTDRLPAALALENAALRTRVDDLLELLQAARDENSLLTTERDNALLEIERWHQKYRIASGTSGF